MGIASSKLFREHISCFSSFAAADAACSPVFWSGCAEESSWTPISEIGRKMQLHRRHTKKVREVMEGDPQGQGTLYAICYMPHAVCCMRYANARRQQLVGPHVSLSVSPPPGSSPRLSSSLRGSDSIHPSTHSPLPGYWVFGKRPRITTKIANC